MNSSDNRNQTEILASYEALLQGLATAWPASQTSILLQQTTYTVPQFTAKVQSVMAPLQAVVNARSALKTAIDDRTVAMPGIVQFLAGVYAVLPQYLGATADLTKFGKKPAKARQPLTTEQRAAANAKAAATRAARHTMGKNQKKAIKGTVATAPATPVAPATPAVTPATPAVTPATGK
jgi:hypothetical protein